MRYYKLFRKYQGGVGWVEQDPLILNVVSKTTDNEIVETLAPTKITTYYANGHYYVSLNVTEYTLDIDYKLIWTFEMVEGHVQTIIEYFRLSLVGDDTALILGEGDISVPVQGKKYRALARFGDTLLIVRDDGSTLILGKSWANRRIANYWLRQYVLNVMFIGSPEIFGGDVIRDVKRSKYYFVYNLHKLTLRENVIEQNGTLLYINKACEIQRLQGTVGPFGGTKQSFSSQVTDVRCHLREITADLRTERPGLLERASSLLYTQNDENLQILDRIIIDSVNYQVEHIDKTTYQGLFEAELSLDKRE